MAREDEGDSTHGSNRTINMLKHLVDEARISTLSPEDRLGYELGNRLLNIWHEYGRRDAKYLEPAQRILAALRFIAAATIPIGCSSEEHMTELLLLGLSEEISRAYVTLRKM